MRTYRYAYSAVVTLFTLCGSQQAGWGAEPVAAELEKVTRELTAEKVTLKYAYRDGEKLHYRVEHVSTVEARMKGIYQTSKSRSEAVKTWHITGVNDTDKSMQFEHQIESVDMWSEVTGKKPIRYNSKTDARPPEQYANVAESLRKPLSRITMDEHGQILERKDFLQQIDMGMGGISIPLPTEPVGVGHEWSTAYDLRVRDPQNRLVTIKTRQVFQLKHVATGVATISIKTQVLTPLHDPAVRSQILQRLSNGELKFDIDAGRILRRELDWNETVISFSGQDSNMKYMARLIEELIPESPDNALANASP